MTNFRVRQVLALGAMPDRQLRLLVALATFMSDESRLVKVGFGELIRCTGRTHNTVRAARTELESSGRLSSVPGRGAGVLTLWTVLCLPEKGTSDVGTFPAAKKGTNYGPKKVPTEGQKRYQAKRADQPEPERGLNLLAKDSLSAQLGGMLAADVPDATEREIDVVVERAKGKDIPVAWLRKIIDNGDAIANILQAREQIAKAAQQAERRRRLAEAEPVTAAPAPVPDPEQRARVEDATRLAFDEMRAAIERPHPAATEANR